MTRLVTFTNLFPSELRPTHGLFVWERMHRVAAELGWDWQVVCPIPKVPWPMRRGEFRAMHREPERDTWRGVAVTRPRYRHVPRLSGPRQAANMARGVRSTLAQLLQGGDAVLDAHYAYPDGVAAAQIAGELGVPCMVTARGSDVNLLGRDPVLRGQMQRALPMAGILAAVSHPLRDAFAEALGVGTDRVLVARNGVDLDVFHPGDREGACAALGLDPARRWLVGVGRLVAGKGFGTIVRALESLPEDVHLALVGDGPEQRALQAMGGARVTFLGARPPGQVALALQAAAVAVLPSHREGWPNAVTEALASGTPVVATPVGAVPTMLADPVAGRMAPIGDAVAHAAAIRDLLAAPPASEAVRRWAEGFGWTEPVAALSAAFRALHAGADPGAAFRAVQQPKGVQ